MTNIRRYYREGQIYFLTHVTSRRRPLLVAEIDLFQDAFSHVVTAGGADSIAWVVLPDHSHLIIDPKCHDLSRIMKRFKLKFSGLYRSRHGLLQQRLRQNRFWDHIIRDQEDLNRHIDYVHYNPVKHGFVADPFLYEHSTLHEYFRAGYYERDWGCQGLGPFDGEFGE